MSLSASTFIQNRREIVSLTNDRIKHILWYIVECYQLLQKDKPTYSKSDWKKKSTISFEDYLKMELVDKYLVINKDTLKTKISALEEINFAYETQKRYVDTSDKMEKPDKIDIYINKLGLQNEWKEHDENLYFAIECKRVKFLSDTKYYIEDIQKFADRNHTNLRLPFEGMIAFIENKKLTHSQVSDNVNNRLKNLNSIDTIKKLNLVKLHNTYTCTYSSVHKKNYNKKIQFSVFHLLFDYSQNVIN